MNKRGFTLVELLVVIAVIMILAGMLFAAMGAVQKRAQKRATEAVLMKVDNALRLYKADFDEYPYYGSVVESNADDLYKKLVKNDYLEEKDFEMKYIDRDNDGTGDTFMDVWGERLIYVVADPSSGNRPAGAPTAAQGFKYEFELWSQGPDKDFDTDLRGSSSSDDDYDNITITPYK